MKLFEIVGKVDTDLEGFVFGQFTSRKLAEKALTIMPAELEDVEIRENPVPVNSLEIDGKIIEITEENNG